MSIHYSAATGGFYNSAIHRADQLPADAVVITAALHQTLLAGQAAGQHIVADANGYPQLQTPTVSHSQQVAQQCQRIDTAAGQARARFVSAGQLVEEEYHLALKQTQAWRAQGSPANAVPPAVQDWATATGISAEAAAVSIEQTATAWEAVLITVRRLRLQGKTALENASPQANLAALAQETIDQLNALQP